jgi:hypothetical protein
MFSAKLEESGRFPCSLILPPKLIHGGDVEKSYRYS